VLLGVNIVNFVATLYSTIQQLALACPGVYNAVKFITQHGLKHQRSTIYVSGCVGRSFSALACPGVYNAVKSITQHGLKHQRSTIYVSGL
jgi:4-hydroxy-3-methylbut-2-enyl diphosphate reductase IspH